MKLRLLLAGALSTTTAAADGFVGSVRLGTAYIHADPSDHGFGYVGAIAGGYQYGRFRGSLALDFTSFETSSADTKASNLLESATAQLQVDVISDIAFVFAGIGASTLGGNNQEYELRYQVGLGGRYWINHDNAIRLDASLAGDKLRGEDLLELGAALGYEYYF